MRQQVEIGLFEGKEFLDWVSGLAYPDLVTTDGNPNQLRRINPLALGKNRYSRIPGHELLAEAQDLLPSTLVVINRHRRVLRSIFESRPPYLLQNKNFACFSSAVIDRDGRVIVPILLLSGGKTTIRWRCLDEKFPAESYLPVFHDEE